jgi:hypothetical protein
MSRLGRWWVGHRGLWPLHRLLHRGAAACLICRAVWANLEDRADIVEAIRRGKTDFDSGRWYHYEPGTGRLTPNPDWPKDGPQP